MHVAIALGTSSILIAGMRLTSPRELDSSSESSPLTYAKKKILLSLCMIKSIKIPMRPVKNQIRLGGRQVLSDSSLDAWENKE